MNELKIGDVVCLPSSPELLMTIVSKGDVTVEAVYFNGGHLIKERFDMDVLKLASELSDKDYVISALKGLAEKQLEMLQALVDSKRIS